MPKDINREKINLKEHNKAWRPLLGRLNYVQMLIGRYHFSQAGFMTPKDVINMLIEFDAGMHANPQVREQAKLLCSLIIESEDDNEEKDENGKEAAAAAAAAEATDGKKYIRSPPGTRARATLEPFLLMLYDDRRVEFESDIFAGSKSDVKSKKKKKNKKMVGEKSEEDCGSTGKQIIRERTGRSVPFHGSKKKVPNEETKKEEKKAARMAKKKVNREKRLRKEAAAAVPKMDAGCKFLLLFFFFYE
jgi:hypothetical protein